jgi:proline iminopeptidase
LNRSGSKDRVVADDGCRLWTASSGSGPPVVLCHGGPGLWDYLAPVAEMLDDTFAIHRWDQRGCGRSGGAPPYTLQQFVDDLDAVRRHFGHESWIVGGHSWGARLALEYALQHPARTQAMLYISGTGIGGQWRDYYYTERHRRLAAAGAVKRWGELSARERSSDEDRELCLLTWMTDYLDMSVGRVDSADLLSSGFLPNYEVNALLNSEVRGQDEQMMLARCRQLDVPSLVVHGSDDPRPVWAVQSLVAALPRGRLEVIDASGHIPWVEGADIFSTALRRFLGSVPADFP